MPFAERHGLMAVQVQVDYLQSARPVTTPESNKDVLKDLGNWVQIVQSQQMQDDSKYRNEFTMIVAAQPRPDL